MRLLGRERQLKLDWMEVASNCSGAAALRSPWNFVMGDARGREIDLHVIAIDHEGNGIYGPPERGEGIYPAQALQGQGQVEGLAVRCISPEFQIRSHTEYEVDATDYEDVRALVDKFGLEIPHSYQKCFSGEPSFIERAQRHLDATRRRSCTDSVELIRGDRDANDET